jgi:hypothetical protein
MIVISTRAIILRSVARELMCFLVAREWASVTAKVFDFVIRLTVNLAYRLSSSRRRGHESRLRALV